jgi:hypothetical protein
VYDLSKRSFHDQISNAFSFQNFEHIFTIYAVFRTYTFTGDFELGQFYCNCLQAASIPLFNTQQG